jgi:hypothetical protein
MGGTDLLMFSLPPERLLGYFFPDFGGHHEYMVYTGAVVLPLLITALLWKKKSRQLQFWLWAGLVSLLYALGSNTPLATLLSALPGFDLLRVPSRALFATSFCLAAATAHTVDVLLKREPVRRTKWANLVIFGITAFVLLVGIGIWALASNHPRSFLYGAVMFLISAMWIRVRVQTSHSSDEDDPEKGVKGLRRKWVMPATPWYLGLLILAIVDLGIVDLSLLTFRSKEDVLAEGAEAAAYITSQEGLFRVYSPSYSLPQSTAIVFGIPLADGVDPLQLEAYAGFMEEATGVPSNGYHVTIPPFATGNPKVDNQAFVPDADLLGQLNVAYVVSTYDLDAAELVLEGVYGDNYVYRNTLVRPRGWVTQNGGSSKSDGLSFQPVHFTDYGSNRVEVIANGPGTLTLSEIAYPGWRAAVDGSPAAMRVDPQGLFRTLTLEEGEHKVVFEFRPSSVLWGLILHGIGVIIPGILFCLNKKPKNE